MNDGKIHTIDFRDENFPFDAETTRKYMKLGSKSEDKEALLEVCRGLYMRYRHIFRPRVRYTAFKITEKDAENLRIVLSNGTFFSGKGIFRLLSASEMAALYLITLGEEADSEIKRLEGEDFLDGYMLNAAASALIEQIQVKTHGLIQKEVEEEALHLTKRFSPGYNAWDLSEQEKLISMLKGSEIGISLTETYLMIPMKSVSGVYGLNRP